MGGGAVTPPLVGKFYGLSVNAYLDLIKCIDVYRKHIFGR